MQKTIRILAALVVAGTMVMPSAAALSEFFNDRTIRAPEPNGFDSDYSDANGWWSNVRHDPAAENERLGAGMYGLLHGHGLGQGDLVGDFAGTSTTATPKPHLDFVHTNWYGAIIMSDPNDGLSGTSEQRFSYPGYIAFTALYGYYHESFAGSTAVSGSPMKGPKSRGAESINDACWTGNPAFVAGACAQSGSAGDELGNDEFVYIYKAAGGPANDVRDRFNLGGKDMVYAQILESTALVTIPVCSTSPEACAARDAALAAVDSATAPVLDAVPSAHSVYDLFDEDCAAGGDYADECENAPIVNLWDQRVSCGDDDQADRQLRGAAEHSTGNGGPCATGSIPNFPLGDATPDAIPGVGGVVLPDDNSPQQVGDEALKTTKGCEVRQVTDPNSQPAPKDTSGCQDVNSYWEETLRTADNQVPNYVDTPNRPSYRTPPTPTKTPPQVTFAFADSRRGATLDQYTGPLVANYGGSFLNGLHIVTWVGPAQDIDEQGNLVNVNEGPDGWKTAKLRDVDYFSAAGEDTRFTDDPVGFLAGVVCIESGECLE